MRVVKLRPKKVVLYRECPGCAYRVPQFEVEQVRVDIPCIRCGGYLYSQYRPIYGDQDA